MKKLSLLVGGVVLSTVAMAQKPAAADAPFSIEGQLGYNAATFSFNAPSVRARYFVADNIAVRLSLAINNYSTSDIAYENPDFSGGTGTYETKDNSWGLGLGAEYHFTGTDKLSPYVGLDIMFGGSKMTSTGSDVDGANNYSAGDSYEVNTPSSMMGVNLLAGTDYYFAENFYLGFELGWGFSSWTDKEGDFSFTSGGTTTSGKTNAEHKEGALTNNAISMFRLGWRF